MRCRGGAVNRPALYGAGKARAGPEPSRRFDAAPLRPGLPSAAPQLFLQLPAQQRQPGMGRSATMSPKTDASGIAIARAAWRTHKPYPLSKARRPSALSTSAATSDKARSPASRARTHSGHSRPRRSDARAARRPDAAPKAPPSRSSRRRDPRQAAAESAAKRGAVRPRAGRPRRAPAPAPGRRRRAPARRGRGTAATHPTSCRPFSDAPASQPSHSARASAISAQIAQEGRSRRRRRIRRTGSGISVPVRVRQRGRGAGAPAARAENQAHDRIGGFSGLSAAATPR